MRGDTQPDAVSYFAELSREFDSIGMKINVTSEYFVICGKPGDRDECCNLRTVGELKAYLRGVEAVQMKRVPYKGDW